MATTSTVGISFGADALAPIPRTSRQKAEEMTNLEAQRLAALDAKVQGWSDRLDLPDLEAMDQIVRVFRTEGLVPVAIRPMELARRLKCDTADAEARVERLVRAGALERRRRMAQEPVFLPLARGTVASKQERNVAAVRDMAEDAVRAIKGQEPIQRAKAETSTFPAGSIMRGMRGRN